MRLVVKWTNLIILKQLQHLHNIHSHENAYLILHSATWIKHVSVWQVYASDNHVLCKTIKKRSFVEARVIKHVKLCFWQI